MPSSFGSGTNSRQRSPVLGALGKEGKFFQATMPTVGINLADKKLENLNSSFNLTMVPITGSQSAVGPNSSQYHADDSRQQTRHVVVKEEQLEEEEEESKRLEVTTLNDTTVTSIMLDQSCQKYIDTTANVTDLEGSTSGLSVEQIREKCKDRMDTYRKDVKKDMPLSDQLDMRDPQTIADYAQEIFQSMKDKEGEY